MRRLLRISPILIVGLALSPLSAMAGDGLQDRISALEKKVEEQRKGLAASLGIEAHALLSTVYTYSFNTPDSDTIQARTFDSRHNNIDLNQASLFLSRSEKEKNVGFGLTLDFGRVAEGVGAVSCWNGSCDSSEQDNSFEVREAYLAFDVPLGDGITVKAGRFVTLLGYEVLKEPGALNDNISRGIMFGYFLPFTHTGVLASIPLGDMITFDLGVVNGWDDVVDKNDGKTLLGGIGINPSDQFSIYIAGTYGAEDTNRSGASQLGMVTVNAVYAPTDTMSFAIDLNYANESDVLPGRNGRACVNCRGADWYGGAVYWTMQLTERTSFHLRAELLDDPDGRRGLDATVWEITPTVACQVTDNLVARVEYRHDEASKPIFDKDNRTQRGSDTAAVELVYAF